MANECTCGRSPTGKCVGWHGLSKEKYKEENDGYVSRLESQEVVPENFESTIEKPKE